MTTKTRLDPDYRTFPWNRSKYAPSQSGVKNAMGKEVNRVVASTLFILLVLGLPICFCGYLGTLNLFFLVGLIVYVPFSLALSTIRGLRYGEKIKRQEYERLIALHTDNRPTSSWVKQTFVIPDNVESQYILAPAIPESKYMPPPHYNPPYVQPTYRALSQTTQTPEQFEHEVAHIINVGTGLKATVVGGSGDGGVDILLFKGNQRVGVVQCKMYKGIVPPLYIRELATVQRQLNVKRAYLVTTGTFSEASFKEAKALGITLIDHAKLEKLRKASRSKIGKLRAKQ